MTQYLSLVPGPTQVHPRVLAAMSQQVKTHLDEDWRPLYLDTCEKMKKIFRTSGDIFLMASSGTGAMEAVVSSLLEPGQKLLVLSNGLFGDRIAMIAESYHMEVEVLAFRTTGAINPECLRRRLEEGGVYAVGAVYSESQNGILNPIQEIAAVCGDYDVPLVVDTVSALAGVDFKMDEWGIDFAVSAAQKCIGGVVGMSMVAVSQKAWKYVEEKKGTGFYFNLSIWRDSIQNNIIHPHPWSMSETMIYGLNEACNLILEEGLDRRIARHREQYNYYVDALSDIGFSMFAEKEFACPTVVAIQKHPAMSVAELASRLKTEYGILIGVGIYQQQGKIWRIGNMAEQAKPEKARCLVDAVKEITATLPM